MMQLISSRKGSRSCTNHAFPITVKCSTTSMADPQLSYSVISDAATKTALEYARSRASLLHNIADERHRILITDVFTVIHLHARSCFLVSQFRGWPLGIVFQPGSAQRARPRCHVFWCSCAHRSSSKANRAVREGRERSPHLAPCLVQWQPLRTRSTKHG